MKDQAVKQGRGVRSGIVKTAGVGGLYRQPVGPRGRAALIRKWRCRRGTLDDLISTVTMKGASLIFGY
jgi:hypothetical protein